MRTTFVTLLSILIASASCAYGQSPNDTYIIGKSVDTKSNANFTGLLRNNLESSDRDTTPPIIFRVNSEQKGYRVILVHFGTKSRPSRIVEMDHAKLQSLNAIDADEFIKTKTKEQADQWGRDHINKTIWVIDRNDFRVSQGQVTMTLIETTIDPMSYPDTPIVTED